jgi:glucose/arabinose dehydrogenase
MMPKRYCVLLVNAALLACAYAHADALPITAGMGPNPTLPPPQESLVPVVDVPHAKGWPKDAAPTAAPGLSVTAFARGLNHPRWLYVLPNGDVLVAETDTPSKPQDGKGLRGWVSHKLMHRAGSGRKPSPNRIALLRDTKGSGVADVHTVFLQGLNSPFGMTLDGNGLYVAATDSVLRFPYSDGDTQITASGTKITDLPAGPINHHWTKSLVASPDGSKLYVGVGSNSNAGENGMEQEQERAAVWEIDPKTGNHRVFASGLRNPVGLAWEPHTGALWVAVNERDELGNDLVPDYMTAVREGAFYGWPYSYFGTHLDPRVKPQDPDLVAQAVVPDYALGDHTASLGLCSAADAHLPPPFTDGMFVGQHGSWNRKPISGYKVVFVPFDNGKPTAPPIDVLSGFVSADGDETYGRPVGVAIDKNGDLLVADDVGNTVWRVTAAGAQTQTMNARTAKNVAGAR